MDGWFSFSFSNRLPDRGINNKIKLNIAFFFFMPTIYIYIFKIILLFTRHRFMHSFHEYVSRVNRNEGNKQISNFEFGFVYEVPIEKKKKKLTKKSLHNRQKLWAFPPSGKNT